MNPEDKHNALKASEEQLRRRDMLTQPHMVPLTKYLEKVKCGNSNRDMPDFDPCDGGINAKVLFLLEAPGPKAVGSTFISRNNPDPTARNMCDLMNGANIPRCDTLLWNIIPWYIGNEEKTKLRSAIKEDVVEFLAHLPALLDLLPKLQVIVLVGKHAQSARKSIEHWMNESAMKLTIIETHHMSGRVFNRWPSKKKESEQDFIHIAQLLAALETPK